MKGTPTRKSIIGMTLVDVRHSPYFDPVFIIEGIGPAQFRLHFLLLQNGTIVNLGLVSVEFADISPDSTPGESDGIPLATALGRKIVAVAFDNVSAAIVILHGRLYLRDANDGCYGNPLLIGRLREDYAGSELAEFVDYWSGEPLQRELLIDGVGEL
jgi:hypothetical protein